MLPHHFPAIAVPPLDRNVSMPMGNESSEDAVARVLPVLQETARGRCAI